MKYLSAGLLRLLIMLSVLFPVVLKAQMELVPVDHKVYPFLEMMSMKGLIDYNNASIPLSRRRVASYLEELDKVKSKLSPTEQKILADLLVEFSYDINRNLDKSYTLVQDFKASDPLSVFNDEKQKYLVSYTDPNFSLFLDGIGAVSYRNFDAQSFPKAHLSLFEIGPRLRGTLFDNIGYYVQVTEGQAVGGDQYARQVASGYDPLLTASYKFVGNKFITGFNAGYLRYSTDNHAFALTIGRDNFEMGNGYIDKLFISDHIPPFDFGRLDINYKFFHYSFFYGNLQGDSLGVPLASKNIVGHRLDIVLSPTFRFGMYEALILSNEGISFTYLNPISVIESENLSTGPKIDALNNTLMGFDCEIRPYTNMGLQLTLLIDDLNTSTLGKKTPAGDDNKFGYQAGFMYAEPFGINDLTAIVEYTLLDPFVYSHRTNMSTYTSWGISLGSALPPNSDQIALELNYYLTNRITLNFQYKHQRSGEGFLDANGNPTLSDLGIITRNFGGDVNRGDLDSKYTNDFLMGLRVNRDIFSLSARIEPIRQYFIDLTYSLQAINEIYASSTYSDQFFYATISTDF
jgi:Capsule assembly protein Wzi